MAQNGLYFLSDRRFMVFVVQTLLSLEIKLSKRVKNKIKTRLKNFNLGWLGYARSVISKQVPVISLLWTETSPPWASAICLTIARPSPIP